MLALVASHPLTLAVLYIKSEMNGFRPGSVFFISVLWFLRGTSGHFKWVGQVILQPGRIRIGRPGLERLGLCVGNTRYFVRSY